MRVSSQVEPPRLRMHASPAQCGASFVALNDELAGNGTDTVCTSTSFSPYQMPGPPSSQVTPPLSRTTASDACATVIGCLLSSRSRELVRVPPTEESRAAVSDVLAGRVARGAAHVAPLHVALAARDDLAVDDELLHHL